MDIHDFEDRLLGVDDLLLLNIGPDQFVPFVVRRAKGNELLYDPVLQVAIAGPQVPSGATASASQAATFVDNVQFGLSPTVTSISNVNDIFWNLAPYEIYQVFVGVAPRYERVWIKQPYGNFQTGLEQAITPTSTYPDVGFFDGFRSPYGRPSRTTETFILVSTSVNFTLYNAAPWIVSPRFAFFINRLFVQPVRDPAVVKALLNRSIHARYYSMGNPLNGIPWPKSYYGDIDPLPGIVGSYPTKVPLSTPSNIKTVERAMAAAGYLAGAGLKQAKEYEWGVT